MITNHSQVHQSILIPPKNQTNKNTKHKLNTERRAGSNPEHCRFDSTVQIIKVVYLH